MEKSEITLFAQYSELLVSIHVQNSKACLEIRWLLSKASLTVIFSWGRNSKGTESGLAAIPDLWLSLSIAIRLYVCTILHILAEPRDCTIVKEKNRDGQLQKVGIVHLRYWNWGLECLVSFYTALIPFSYLSQASSPIQFPQPTCSCTTHFLSEAENLSNACSMTNTCWRRETC